MLVCIDYFLLSKMGKYSANVSENYLEEQLFFV